MTIMVVVTTTRTTMAFTACTGVGIDPLLLHD